MNFEEKYYGESKQTRDVLHFEPNSIWIDSSTSEKSKLTVVYKLLKLSTHMSKIFLSIIYIYIYISLKQVFLASEILALWAR